MYVFLLQRMASKRCTIEGEWFVSPDTNMTWTNYSQCYKKSTIDIVVHYPALDNNSLLAVSYFLHSLVYLSVYVCWSWTNYFQSWKKRTTNIVVYYHPVDNRFSPTVSVFLYTLSMTVNSPSQTFPGLTSYDVPTSVPPISSSTIPFVALTCCNKCCLQCTLYKCPVTTSRPGPNTPNVS